MKDVFARFGLAERLLWEHAVAAGVACGVIARSVSGFSRDEAFLSGLVHDVGKLVMYSQADALYQRVVEEVYANERPSIEAEREVFGFDHAQVGFHLLRRWKLADRMSQAVGAHHDLSLAEADGSKPLASLIQVADSICHREGAGRRKPAPEIDPSACAGAEVLGIGAGDVEDLLAAFRQEHEREKQVFA
jgi:HD-like signal output (HDOD) protein